MSVTKSADASQPARAERPSGVHRLARWGGRARRALGKPPSVVARRLLRELEAEADRFAAPRRARQFDRNALLAATGSSSLESLWARLGARAYPAVVGRVAGDDYHRLCPLDGQRIFAAAGRALARRINLLGSGPLDIGLGGRIDWHTDHKTGRSWPAIYMRDIDYTNLDEPSDVKIPWEISRLQWLIPAGQAYLLSGDDRYARGVRDILDDWIAANPYARSVNWACTMEVSLRILSWTWFFHVFHRSTAWTEEGFRERFLRALFLHGDFTERHLERSDVNGNHFTADAAGLVFAGLFFGDGPAPRRWVRSGWELLTEELPRQVFPDGVDFEGSVAYHRLVFELFFLPARYREAQGLDVPSDYRGRLVAMARFAAAYSRPDGTAPLWGDADDGRALPFGGQSVNDHRYLPGLVSSAWDQPELIDGSSGPLAEVFWLLGPGAASRLAEGAQSSVGRSFSSGAADSRQQSLTSVAFSDGGFYIMRNDRDHLFIDCGPVGQAGRGGHGHNDCLSFEAVLDGVHLVSDCGAFLYTASPRERNHFRSTAAHNTPRIDGQEINRFIRWDYLWNLQNDAHPEVRRWKPGVDRDFFCGGHTGYRRLGSPVMPDRTMILDHARHALVVHDAFEGTGIHHLEIPLHLAPGVEACEVSPGCLRLRAQSRAFMLAWSQPDAWVCAVELGRVSPSYGVALPVVRLAWRRDGSVDAALTLCVLPENAASPSSREDALAWAADVLSGGRL